MIPRKIFQTWKTKEPTGKKAEFIQSLRKVNKDFQHFLYDDKECNTFVKEKYPEYHPYYERLETAVQKADMWRYLVVHQYGGWYSDADCYCVKSFNDVKIPIGNPDRDLIIVEREFPRRFSVRRDFARDLQYAQFWFAATPKHPALLNAVNKIVKNMNNGIDLQHDITGDKYTLNLTGPGPFSDAIVECDKSKILEIEPNIADRITHPIMLAKSLQNMKTIPLVHHCDGSWREEPKNDWIFIITVLIIVVLALLVFYYFSSVKNKSV